VYLDSHVNPDFSDIRFTTPDNTLIPYWVQETGSDHAVVWVRVPSISTEGTDLYLYYGNPAVSSLSNGEETFVFFDHFEGNGIDTAKWQLAGSGTRTVGNSIVKQGVSGSGTAESMTGITDKTGDNIVLGVRHRVVQATAQYCGGRYGVQSDYKVAFHNNGGTQKQFLNEATAWGNTLGPFNLDQWYVSELVHDGSRLLVRDDYASTWTAWPVSGKSGHITLWAYAYGGGTAATDVDYVYQRQYAAIEPGHGNWGTEDQILRAPVANFTANVTSGPVPLTVQFWDASSYQPTAWNWSFGDGTPNSTDRNPVHTYTAPGIPSAPLAFKGDSFGSN